MCSFGRACGQGFNCTVPRVHVIGRDALYLDNRKVDQDGNTVCYEPV